MLPSLSLVLCPYPLPLQLSASKIHRVYLVDERDVVQRVISLSDILALFSQEPEPGYLNASFSLS